MQQEPNMDIFKGIIYSEFIESEFKPKIWLPNSLSLEIIQKIVNKATSYFSTNGEEDWAGKTSILPIPINQFLGLTYFYKLSTELDNNNLFASLTILINENASEFFYRNINKLKQDLEILANTLNKTDDQRSILSEYYSNIIEFIDRYQNFRKLSDVAKKIEDVITGCVLLTYFHSKLGPRSFYCYPENFLSKNQQQRLNNELQYSSEEGLFIKSYLDFNVIHLYFEIKSERARGHVEMCLISLILEKMPSKEIIDNISFRLLDLIDELYLKSDVSLAFYETEYDIKKDFDKIKPMSDFLRNWVRKVYSNCIEEYFKKSSEGDFAKILMDLNRVKLLKKLSEEPIELNKLKYWVLNKLGKQIDFNGLISPLIDSNFIKINETLGNDHVVLLKGISVYRISPTNTLEKLKSFISIYPEIYPDLLKQYTKEIRQFFRRYKPTIHETVLLARIIFDPINYLIISKLRRGSIYLKDEFIEAIGKNIYELASHNLKYLKEHNIITEIRANDESFILLKTDIKFVKTIPKFIILEKKNMDLLPEPLKKVSNNISKTPDEIKNIFKRWFS